MYSVHRNGGMPKGWSLVRVNLTWFPEPEIDTEVPRRNSWAWVCSTGELKEATFIIADLVDTGDRPPSEDFSKPHPAYQIIAAEGYCWAD